MNIIPRKSFEEMDNFFRDDDWFFPVFSSRKFFEPEMDIYETEKTITAEVNLPDINPEDVNVSVEDGVLIISGEFEEKEEEKEKNYWRREIRKGSFQRSARLPAEVNVEKAEADYEKGILKINLPKMGERKKKGKEIKIKEK